MGHALLLAAYPATADGLPSALPFDLFRFHDHRIVLGWGVSASERSSIFLKRHRFVRHQHGENHGLYGSGCNLFGIANLSPLPTRACFVVHFVSIEGLVFCIAEIKINWRISPSIVIARAPTASSAWSANFPKIHRHEMRLFNPAPRSIMSDRSFLRWLLRPLIFILLMDCHCCTPKAN